MKRLIPLLVGLFPALFGYAELWLISGNTETFLLLILIGTLVFLPAWWGMGYLCGKLKLGILLPTVLAMLPLLLGAVLFCIPYQLPAWLDSIAYASTLPLFSISIGMSFLKSIWATSFLALLPAIAVFWLGCTKVTTGYRKR